jgi:hypothetical protein
MEFILSGSGSGEAAAEGKSLFYFFSPGEAPDFVQSFFCCFLTGFQALFETVKIRPANLRQGRADHDIRSFNCN